MASKEECVAKIAAIGDEIRTLKADKVPKSTLQPVIDKLLAAKAEYKAVTGEEYIAPNQGSSRKRPTVPDVSAGPDVKTKKQEARLKREKEKAEKKAQREAASAKKSAKSTEVVDPWRFGHAPLVQSATISDRVYSKPITQRKVEDLGAAQTDQTVWVRASLHTSRVVGKGVFLLLRQSIFSVQAMAFARGNIHTQFVEYASSLSKESIVDVKAVVRPAPTPIESATQKNVELHMEEIHAVSLVEGELPFQVEDAARGVSGDGPRVLQDIRLDYRWIDLRTPANQAIFRIQSGVCRFFREFLQDKDFVEIHSPKLLGGASEGGANCFRLDYFGQPACLAQSPQLYKQMAAACGGFGRVFEIGPVFRAENSLTHRHMCEFTGLDFEMTIDEHYYEVLDLFSELFISIFDNLNARFASELATVATQYPFEPLKYCRPTLRLTYYEGIQLLQDAGFDADPDEDLSTEHEKALGKIVKEMYGTDFFMMDKYPLAIRPFYSMPCPDHPKLSNSFDIFIRGEEIVSGAQRIHDVNLLEERAKWWEIPLDSIASYLDAFRHGAQPHGGGGIGMERVVMLFLGLKNIRSASMFPRDPKRLTP